MLVLCNEKQLVPKILWNAFTVWRKIPDLMPDWPEERNSYRVWVDFTLKKIKQPTWCLVSVCAFDFWDAHAYPASHPVTSSTNENDANRQANTFPPWIKPLFQEPSWEICMKGEKKTLAKKKKKGGKNGKQTFNVWKRKERIKQTEKGILLQTLASLTAISTANTWERILLFVDY